MSIKTNNSKILIHGCRICGAPAQYSYFGVLSCEPCKVFFRRYAQRNETTFICHSNGQCEINADNRQTCKSCRLAKCFQRGMSTDKFRGPTQKKGKAKDSIRVLLQYKPERLRTLNLLQSDQSLLTTDQWTLLSNLSHCYKEYQVIPFTQRLIDAHNDVQYTYTMYEALVDEFLVAIYEAAGAYLLSNDDIRRLSFDDRSAVVRYAANNVCCMSGSFIMQHCLLYGLNAFLRAMNMKYGKQTMDIHIWARKFIDPDVTIIKLAISLFAFSGNTSSYYTDISNDLTISLYIFEIQNKYADVAWKYLLYKYGYYAAVKRFLNLTLWLIAMNTLVIHAQSLVVHLNDIDSVIEKTELSLILDDVEDIVETEP